MRKRKDPTLNSVEAEAPAVSRMMEYARQAGRATNNLVLLVRGEPDFTTPVHIREALLEALEAGYTHYPVTHGYPQLRRAVAARVLADDDIQWDPDEEVLITSGSTAGMYLALRAVLHPGDEVLLPDPVYDPYAGQVRAAGGRPVSVLAARKNGHFYLPREALAEAVTPRTRALILNTPWNPTGTVCTREELTHLGEFALEHELVVIVDEIYEKLVYDRHAHVSLASLNSQFRDSLIMVKSTSKTYAMTGWRLGYNLANVRLTRAMRLHQQQFSRGSAAFVQRAAIAALEGPQECVTEMVAEYDVRRQLMVKLISQIEGVTCIQPEGTFFCLVDAHRYSTNAEKLAQYLVREWGLLTVPGTYYGRSLEGHLRLSFAYAREDISAGVELLAQGLGQVGQMAS